MDIHLLAEKLLAETRKGFGKPIRAFTDQALAVLKAYDWPGNVRELQNEIQRMVALADGDMLDAALISPRIRARACPGGRAMADAGQRRTLKDHVEALEAQLLGEALGRHRWNISRVADELGLSRVGLRAKLHRYGLERAE
jgi:two-component system response regulator HupR/HoxA